jgi:hypothetical protein
MLLRKLLIVLHSLYFLAPIFLEVVHEPTQDTSERESKSTLHALAGTVRLPQGSI